MNGGGPIVNINGQIFLPDEAKISVFDHGVLYGDGCFEGVRFMEKGILFHEEHRDRLFRSAALLRLPKTIQSEPEQQITPEFYDDQIFSAVRESGLETGYIRAIWTRGRRRSLGIEPQGCVDPQLIIIITTLRLYEDDEYARGIDLIFARTQKPPLAVADCRIKSCNYLNNVMAAWEYLDRAVNEAIMVTTDGLVSEATVENIFAVRNGTLVTPGLHTNCLEGITRGKVMEVAHELGLTVIEGSLTPHDLITAHEVFLTGTGAGIVPVRKIEHQTIGPGHIGTMTAQIRDAYESRLGGWCTPVPSYETTPMVMSA